MRNGTTNTGLDLLVKLIGEDEGLAARTPQEEIDAGAAAADRMNAIIIEGIQALGLVNDGEITAGDIRSLSDWITETNKAEFIELHGDDEGDVETGFHLIQNDGGAIKLYGKSAINTVADGLYHLVFGYEGANIINEDGNRNARLEDLAWWLGELLEDEIAAAGEGQGPLFNAAVDAKAVTLSGTGMDDLIEIILDDPGLGRNIPTSELAEGAQAGADINQMILDVIEAQGLANDGKITASDVYNINAAIRADAALYERFVALHGDDEGDQETGFHLVQNDGSKTRLYDQNAANTVADGIYHIGFEIVNGRFRNEDGDANASVETVASWINNLLDEDLATGALANGEVSPLPGGATGTGLDRLVDIVETDIGLERKIAVSDIAGGADAANTMNALLLEGIIATGAANDGAIQTSDMRDVNAWLRADADRYASFVEAHGDDENNEETGFHLVQNDGAESRLYGENAVNTIADGIYHFGFEIRNGRFNNEDGNANQSVEDVAAWVDQLLSDEDLAALANPSVTADVAGSTGTGLDRIVEIIMDDPGLGRNIATSEIVGGALAADGLNAMIVEGVEITGAANDGVITDTDVLNINAWIQADADRFARFVELHGDDEGDVETGFHLVQNDGAVTSLYGRNAVNTVADGLYHIGFDVVRGRFQNEDGNANASVGTVAGWLNDLLAEDLLGDALDNPAFDPANIDVATVNQGIVRSVDLVEADGRTGFVELQNGPDLTLSAATMMMSFETNTLKGRDALMSKDGRGNQDGGHVTIFRQGDDVTARVQDADNGDVWLRARDVVEIGETLHVALSIDGATAKLYVNGQIKDAEEIAADWLQADEDVYVGANAWAQATNETTRVQDVFDGSISDFRIYDSALSVTEIQAVSGVTPAGAPGSGDEDPDVALPSGTTGTGLDRIIEIITSDVGLARQISTDDIIGGAEAADVMNGLIVEAIQATGVANDGALTAGDVRDISDWVAANRRDPFIEAHGDDEGNVETGFHLVQNDGAQTRIFGDNAVNTVADGLYHLPFGYRNDRIINEDGDNNQTLEDLGWWLEALLADELTAASAGEGPLANADVDPLAVPATGTGLDVITDIALSDPGLIRNVSTSDLAEGAGAGAGVSQMIVDAIRELGLVDDGDLTGSDVRAINDWIRSDPGRLARFIELHGDDENNEETGFHLIQNDGAKSRLFSNNAINTVADGIFHIGFEIERGRFQNEDGDANASTTRVAYWLSELLDGDIADGSLASGSAPFAGSTGTGLDQLVQIVMNDDGLERKISELDIRGGAEAADTINAMIVEAIVATGVAQNGQIKTSDIYEINRYIRDNHLDAFVEAHGDDEGDVETGFHLVQNDGAETRLYDDNAVNTVADGLYHIGFEIIGGRLRNEDGAANASVRTAAGWLDSLLSDEDYAALAAASTVTPYIEGATGTGLDQLVDIITNDDGLIERISTSDIEEGAAAADEMNEIIVDAIIETGVANDGALSALDVAAINGEIRSDASVAARFEALRGDDARDAETGFNTVHQEGAVTRLFDHSAVNTVADGVYYLGFEIENNRFLNEDGRADVSVKSVAGWLNGLLEDDFETGALVNPDLLPEAVDLAAVRASEVFSVTDPITVTKAGGEREIADSPDFGLAEGTVFLSFDAENIEGRGRDTFFSRDGFGYQDGGHLTIWGENGDLKARFQTDSDQVFLRANDVLTNGEHDLAFTFDGAEALLYLDGALVDAEASAATWELADEDIALGGSLRRRKEGGNEMEDRFEGTIDEFRLFNEALNFAEIQAVAGPDYMVG